MANQLQPDVAWWAGDPAATPKKRYTGSTRTSHYVTVRDGTRIAVDLYLPVGLPADQTIPTVLIGTPYFRSLEFRHPAFEKVVKKVAMIGAAEFATEMTPYGYANVLMDLRGAGASFGTKKSNMVGDVVSDCADVLDWIASQPWSNGRVGATGISGPGMVAQWMTTAKHHALRAIAPRFTVFDIMAGVHTGGITASRFVQDIGRMLTAMDSNQIHKLPENRAAQLAMRLLVRGLRPADEDRDRNMLAAAARGHAANQHFDEDLVAITYRDDQLPSSTEPATLDSVSPFTYAAEMEASGAAIYGWAGWMDGCFIREMLSLHNSVRNPGGRLVIGPWSHGGRWYSSPLVQDDRKEPTSFDHVAEMVRFFDLHLRDHDQGVSSEAPIHYFTMAEERWKTTPVWPPSGFEPTVFHLADSQRLQSTGAPTTAGHDEYAVDYTTGTGVHSRFGKHLAGGRFPVRYPDRAEKDRKLLTYTSAPFTTAVEMTGHPLVTLHVSATATDAAFFVYVEDVAPDGKVLCVADGCLRASARTVAAEPAPYWLPGPWRPYRRDDAQPLVPGEVVELTFDLYPVSWLFRSGHAVRVAIAGADKDNFLPVAEDQSPVVRVYRGGERASRIVLPMAKRS